jgi:UDP-3-O-[3-hydroxymyristoyl] glucosamine N-acyltransferase
MVVPQNPRKRNSDNLIEPLGSGHLRHMSNGSVFIKMKLKEIATLVNGQIIGAGETEITGVSGLSETGPGHITFLSGPKLIETAKMCEASAIIVKETSPEISKPQVVVANPQLAFAKLLGIFYLRQKPCLGISEKAFIAGTARIGNNVTIYPFAYIDNEASIGDDSVIYPGVFIGENSSLGNGCTLYPNVTIREGISIGKRVTFHAGSVIGADGFGYVFDGRAHQKIPQVGGVVIEDDVEIGANTTIDRATTGNTVIGSGTKIDNLVMIAHNVKIGRGAILVSQVGIAGSSTLGDGVVLGGQAGVPDHVNIEAGTMVGAQAGVLGDLKKGIYIGSPAMNHREFFRLSVLFRQLPELKKKIDDLEEAIKSMKGAGGGIQKPD